jgi:hypothetical protein
VALFVAGKPAELTLVALLSHPPDEVLAVRAKSRLSEEPCHKFVVVCLVNLPLFDRLATPLGQLPLYELSLCRACSTVRNLNLEPAGRVEINLFNIRTREEAGG